MDTGRGGQTGKDRPRNRNKDIHMEKTAKELWISKEIERSLEIAIKTQI